MQHTRRQRMAINACFTIRTTPEPSIFTGFKSFQKVSTDLQQNKLQMKMTFLEHYNQSNAACYALCQYNHFKPLPFFQFNFPRNTTDTAGKSTKFCIPYAPLNTI